MNKYLEKIAEQEEKSKLRPGISSGAIGLIGLDAGSGMVRKAFNSGEITGVQTLYHGTTPERASSIRKNGLKPGQTPGVGTGLDAAIGKNSYGTADHVFATPTKPVASQYVVDSGIISKAEDPTMAAANLSMRKNMGDPRYIADVGKQHFKGMLQGYKEGSPYVKLKVPLSELNRVENPEIEALRNNPMFMAGKTPQQQHAMFEMLRNHTIAFKGEVPSKYILGGEGYKAQALSDVLTHIKNNPLMAAKGLGKAGLGVGVMGGSVYGSKKLYDYRTKDTSK